MEKETQETQGRTSDIKEIKDSVAMVETKECNQEGLAKGPTHNQMTLHYWKLVDSYTH